MKKVIIITICGAAIIWTIADFVLALPIKAEEEAKEMDDPFDYSNYWAKVDVIDPLVLEKGEENVK